MTFNGRRILVVAVSVPLFAVLSIGSPGIAGEVAPEQIAFFEAEVRPLLAEKCYQCHGPKQQKSKLRLDSRASLAKGGESGAVVIPGHPDESPLIEAINYESLEMPPDDKLSDKQIATLTYWVKIGAPWPTHSHALRRSLRSLSRIAVTGRSSRLRSQPFRPADRPAIRSIVLSIAS